MTDPHGKIYGHFYKLIVPSILQQKKLRIPKKFVKKFGHELSVVATLTVPDDRIWPMTLEKNDQKFWFSIGWHEFVEHYSICSGHFLVFKYEGNSNFIVHVYVLAPYGKEDSFTVSKPVKDHGNQIYDLDDMEDDDSIEILGSTPARSTSGPWKNKVPDECVRRNTFRKSHSSSAPHNLNRPTVQLDEVSKHPSGVTLKSQSSLQSCRSIGVQFDTNEFQYSANDMTMQSLYGNTEKLESSMTKKQKIDEEILHTPRADDIPQKSTISTLCLGVQSYLKEHKNSADDIALQFSDEAAQDLQEVGEQHTIVDCADEQKTPPAQNKVEANRHSKYERASVREEFNNRGRRKGDNCSQSI